MVDSLQMAEKRALWARWTPRTNGHHPPTAPETEQTLAELRRRIQALEAANGRLEAKFSTLINSGGKLSEPQQAPANPPKRPTLAEITRTVAKEYRVTEGDILSDRQNYPTVMYRHIAIYLCARLTMKRLSEIGRHFARDHATISHARDRIAALRHTDDALRAQLAAFEAKLFPEGEI